MDEETSKAQPKPDESSAHTDAAASEPSVATATPGDTAKAAPKNEQTTLMSILAYIGPLVVVSYLVAEKDPFVKFHIKQGVLLLIGEVAVWILSMMFWPLFPLAQVVNIFLIVLSIVGIVRAVQGEMKELPFIGHWATHLKF